MARRSPAPIESALPRRYWVALATAPLIWFAYFTLAWAAPAGACEGGVDWTIPAITALGTVVATAGLVLALAVDRAERRQAAGAGRGSARMVAEMSLLLSALFLLGFGIAWVFVAGLGACG